MLRIFRHYIPKTLVLLGVAEILILFVSIYLGASVEITSTNVLEHPGEGGETFPLWAHALVFAGTIVLGMMAMGLYHRDQRTQPGAVMLRLVLSFVFGFVLMGMFYLVFPHLMVGGSIYATALVCSFVGIASCRLICAVNESEELGNRVLILGTGESAKQIENLQNAGERPSAVILGYVAMDKDTRVIAETRVFTIERGGLLALAEELNVDEIIVASDDRRKGMPIDDILQCKMYGIRILEASDFYERQLGKIRLDTLHPSNVIFADGFTQAVLKLSEKRVMDVIASTVMLIGVLPIMLLTAAAIYFESGGPVLYRQERVGRRGRVFTLLKFRSMRQDAEANGAVWARDNDDRITAVGSFIRKTRIDELPQLINVLRGDMSFVGPRPERPEFVAELSKAIPYYDLRHHVKPGITGWAQILYPYGASINDSREKLQYDLYYLKNYSIFLDINILLQTIQVILWRKGAR